MSRISQTKTPEQEKSALSSLYKSHGDQVVPFFRKWLICTLIWINVRDGYVQVQTFVVQQYRRTCVCLKGVRKESKKGQLSAAQRWETQPPPAQTSGRVPVTPGPTAHGSTNPSAHWHQVLVMLLLYDIFNFILFARAFRMLTDFVQFFTANKSHHPFSQSYTAHGGTLKVTRNIAVVYARSYVIINT